MTSKSSATASSLRSISARPSATSVDYKARSNKHSCAKIRDPEFTAAQTLPSTTQSDNQPAVSALDTVVRNLTRAAYGQEVKSVPDHDMEQYIADLIMKEARRKHSHYEEHGTSALLERSIVTNKRFLANIIRNTDSHNELIARKEQEDSSRRLHDLQQNQHSRLKTTPGQTDMVLHSVAPQASPTSPISRESFPPEHIPLNSPVENDKTVPNARKMRGRGSTGPRSLDRCFSAGYSPGLDMDNFDTNSLHIYVDNIEKLQCSSEKGDGPIQPIGKDLRGRITQSKSNKVEKAVDSKDTKYHKKKVSKTRDSSHKKKSKKRRKDDDDDDDDDDKPPSHKSSSSNKKRKHKSQSRDDINDNSAKTSSADDEDRHARLRLDNRIKGDALNTNRVSAASIPALPTICPW
ncbi:hypothetical protein BASA60_004272 [Batrachochytrium salamandrivorans]|nr:hypothetical protein BASA60_004272 [Batrachochytrium salamandrivorans]KAH9266138.1 hypothetical protein BASA83_010782 [Batrachochytrium salamandrivorans]